MTSATSSKELIDLLVVGAGPAGLALAVGAVHRGARNVLVVDQSRSLRSIGRQLDMLPNQIRALCALSPEVRPNLEPYLIPMEKRGGSRGVLVYADGELVREMVRSSEDEIATLPWWKLQRVLLDSLPKRPEPAEKFLLLNHQLVDLVQHDDDNDDNSGSVVCTFLCDRERDNRFRNWVQSEPTGEDEADKYAIPMTLAHHRWFTRVDGPSRHDDGDDDTSAVHVSCRARLVIGADGVNSAVRRSVYESLRPAWGDLSDPIYSGYYTAYLKGTHDFSDEQMSALNDEYFHDATLCVITVLRNRPDHHTRPFRALSFQPRLFPNGLGFMALTTCLDETSLKTLSPRALTDLAIEHAVEAGITPLLAEFSRNMANNTQDDSLNIRPFYIVPATHPPKFNFPPVVKPHELPGPHGKEGFDRPWHHGRVVLLGDAAHAAPNFAAQGVGMAVEDGFELSERLHHLGLWSASRHSSSLYSPKTLDSVFRMFRSGREDRNCLHQQFTMERPVDEDEADVMARRLWGFYPDQVSTRIAKEAAHV